MHPMDVTARPPRFLVVCTANICRSPMGEALLRHHLGLRAIESRVLSSGHLPAGTPVSENSVVAMAERDLNIAGRRSVTTSPKLVGGADVILTMGREHVRKVLEVDMSAWPRTFPLPALVRRAHQFGPRDESASLSDWVARLHAGRRAVDMLSEDSADEIADPFGKNIREYRLTADLLDELLGQFVSLAFPRYPPRSGP